MSLKRDLPLSPTSSSQPFTKKMAQLDPVLQVQLLTPNATLPTRGSSLAAGYDLYSAGDLTIPSMGRAVVPTDIAIAVPEGCYGRVAPRSGLAVKFGIQTGAGVVDEDYRGTLGVVLFNLGEQEFKVNKGDRIAQLVIERILTPPIAQVEVLSETTRGAGGFGSTGGFTNPQAAVAAQVAATAEKLDGGFSSVAE